MPRRDATQVERATTSSDQEPGGVGDQATGRAALFPEGPVVRRACAHAVHGRARVGSRSGATRRTGGLLAGAGPRRSSGSSGRWLGDRPRAARRRSAAGPPPRPARASRAPSPATSRSREPAGRDQHAVLQGADRPVVGAHRAGQGPAEPVEVTAHRGQPVVQVAAQRVDLPGVVGQRLLGPGVGDRAQQRDQRASAWPARPACRRRTPAGPARPPAQRRGTTRPARRAPRTPGSSGSPASRTSRPASRRAGAAGGRAAPGGRACSSVVGRRCASRNASSGTLASTTTCLPPARLHHQVGAQPAVVAAWRCTCSVEVAAVDQAGELDDAAQVQLTPAAADLRLAQRGGQRGGLAAQHVGGVPDVVDLLLELALPGDPVLGHVAQLVVQPVEALAHDGGIGRAALHLLRARAARRARRAGCAHGRGARRGLRRGAVPRAAREAARASYPGPCLQDAGPRRQFRRARGVSWGGGG